MTNTEQTLSGETTEAEIYENIPDGRKYELLDTQKGFKPYQKSLGACCSRIRALRDFEGPNGTSIFKGTLGGYVESEKNLFQTGSAWIYDNAVVCGNAVVRDHAEISGAAFVGGHAVVSSYGVIRDHAQRYDEYREISIKAKQEIEHLLHSAREVSHHRQRGRER